MSATTTPIVQNSTSKQERYILTQVGSWVLVFPNRWVTEILRIQRSRILDLPVYQSLLIGVTHHNSQILPLVSAHQVLQTEEMSLRETSTIIHLSNDAGSLSNVGIVVDKALGGTSQDQLPPTLLTTTELHPQDTDSMVFFQPDWFPPNLWHPQV